MAAIKGKPTPENAAPAEPGDTAPAGKKRIAAALARKPSRKVAKEMLVLELRRLRAMFTEIAERYVANAEGEIATLIDAKTVRLGGHLCHDSQGYRSREELAAAWEQCPIKRFRERLLAEGLLTAQDYARLEAEVDGEVAAAVEFARRSPVPESREAFEDLWA